MEEQQPTTTPDERSEESGDKETGAEHWERLAKMAREREGRATRVPLYRRELSAAQSIFLLLVIVFAVLWFKPAQRWEYKVESVPDTNFTTEMNKLGEEGWEMVSARRAASDIGDSTTTKPTFSYEMIFKRPLGRLSFADPNAR